MNQENKVPTPHLEAGLGEIAKTILLPGDPLRAQFIAEHFLTQPKQFNGTRGALGYTGKYQGKDVSVLGTGMGCPSIGIYSYELIHFYGVENLIRVGTAGALLPEVKVRDLVLGMGACTDSHYVRQFAMPGDYSCIADYGLLSRAEKEAAKRKLPCHVGNIVSSDLFYAQGPSSSLDWGKMGVLAVEMEAAALYSNAAAAGAHALCILTISDSLITGEATTAKERQESFTQMMEVALSLA